MQNQKITGALVAIAAAVSFMFAPLAQAEDSLAEVRATIEKALTPIIPSDDGIGEVKKTGMAGIYEVELKGSGQTVYFSADGKYMLAGSLYQLTSDRLVNLTEQKKNKQRKQLLADVQGISYPAVGEQKAEIKVFTDITCPYCRKLHAEIPALNKAGVKVTYLAFPRAGIGSRAYTDLVSIYCAKDPQQAMNKAKKQQSFKRDLTCDDQPVDAHYSLVQKLGVTGTPAIAMADGTLIPGYRPAAAILAQMGL
ncbi:DsbC family protein [Pelagibaculum spongiae]|nr:DsbC family protein [Pelagibaculum spongiae]